MYSLFLLKPIDLTTVTVSGVVLGLVLIGVLVIIIIVACYRRRRFLARRRRQQPPIPLGELGNEVRIQLFLRICLFSSSYVL